LGFGVYQRIRVLEVEGAKEAGVDLRNEPFLLRLPFDFNFFAVTGAGGGCALEVLFAGRRFFVRDFFNPFGVLDFFLDPFPAFRALAIRATNDFFAAAVIPQSSLRLV
jgi:hypothetical protein